MAGNPNMFIQFVSFQIASDTGQTGFGNAQVITTSAIDEFDQIEAVEKFLEKQAHETSPGHKYSVTLLYFKTIQTRRPKEGYKLTPDRAFWVKDDLHPVWNPEFSGEWLKCPVCERKQIPVFKNGTAETCLNCFPRSQFGVSEKYDIP